MLALAFNFEQSTMPKTHFFAFIWDKKYRLSVDQMVKDLTKTPFNPAAEHIFAFSDILPLELKFLSQKVNLLRFSQIIKKLRGHCNLQLHLYKLNLTFSPCLFDRGSNP